MTPAAYENLKFYQNICDIRRIVYQITESFRGTHIRLVSGVAQKIWLYCQRQFSVDLTAISEVTNVPKYMCNAISQMRDSARSAKQNIREGYRKDTAGEFARSIKISAGSLSELEGDIDDCFEDGLITEQVYRTLKDLLGKTNYQIDRYLDSLYKLNKEGKWKSRFKK